LTLPYLTADLPGTGGLLRASPEDFVVEEVPSYLPSGEGPHLYVRVEKVGRTTEEVARELARAIRVDAREAGWAGQKDKQARTVQWLSVPLREGREPPALESLGGEGWRALEMARHRNRLRVGHLRGNRFRIAVRAADGGAEATAREVLEKLQRDGAPNFYGPQRFGRGGEAAEMGRRLLAGDADAERRMRRERSKRRFAISAFQSLLFNRACEQRLREGPWTGALAGDVLKKRATGGLFVCEDVAADGPRVAAGEADPTGPIFGWKMMRPAGESWAREQTVLREAGLASLDDFRRGGGEAEGTRRPYRIAPEDVQVALDAGVLTLAFTLPSGAYATSVLREVTKLPALDGATVLPG
jgi:tRNA pseudouridine13 synthase